jgi:hypothetical protein
MTRRLLCVKRLSMMIVQHNQMGLKSRVGGFCGFGDAIAILLFIDFSVKTCRHSFSGRPALILQESMGPHIGAVCPPS